MLRSVCPDCGSPFERDTHVARCPACQPDRHARPDNTGRKAQWREANRRPYMQRSWRRLSKMARDRQPFCSDCGSPYNLTADHSPEAWRRHDRGLAIRLEDIDVVCARCNAERGPARGPDARERDRPGLPDLEELDDDEAQGPAGAERMAGPGAGSDP